MVAIDDSGLDSTIDVYAAKVAEDYTAFKVKGEMPEDSIIPAEWVDGCSAADAQRYFHPVFENKSIEPEAQTLWKYNKLNMGCVDVDQQKTDKVDSKTEGCWLRNCMVGKAFLLFHYLLIFVFLYIIRTFGAYGGGQYGFGKIRCVLGVGKIIHEGGTSI